VVLLNVVAVVGAHGSEIGRAGVLSAVIEKAGSGATWRTRPSPVSDVLRRTSEDAPGELWSLWVVRVVGAHGSEIGRAGVLSSVMETTGSGASLRARPSPLTGALCRKSEDIPGELWSLGGVSVSRSASDSATMMRTSGPEALLPARPAFTTGVDEGRRAEA
jgi:hypothetical protein